MTPGEPVEHATRDKLLRFAGRRPLTGRVLIVDEDLDVATVAVSR
jgi:hypothetical protein